MKVRQIRWMPAAAFVALACVGPAATTVVERTTPAEIVEVVRGDFRDVLLLSGEVGSAGGEIIVVPRIPNWQTSIQTIVKDGTRVEAGDVVAELDSTQFSSGLEQRRQTLTDSIQSIAQQIARNEAELTQKAYDLEQRRVAARKAETRARIPQEILPLRDWEESQLAFRRAATELEKAENDLEAERRSGEAELANLRLTKAGAEREIAIAESAIESLTLRAQSSGLLVIGENENTGRRFQKGDTVWTGQKIASIPDLSALRVTAKVIDVDDGRVAPGMKVEIVIDAFPEKTFAGRVATVGIVAEALSRESLRRGFHVEIDLDDVDRDLLRPGYSVRAAIERAYEPGVLLVPRKAVDFSGSAPVVRGGNGSVIDGVVLGRCNAQHCVLASGLDAGHKLAVAGSWSS
jgi:HlyD family secretion protein